MTKSVEFYMEKGLDRKMAEYFASGTKRIVGVIPNDDFTLTITFDNGEKRCYDVKPFLKPNTVFETFMDLTNFRRVYVDDTHCIAWDIDPTVDSNEVWNNKVDLCPDCCYVDSVPVTK
ncbi:MAG: DUF2442 domain-containing protein [Phascolarctobacterium sp.]|nr:DUF2442 domain-containing protein [Phascolarctobacterium sp.]